MDKIARGPRARAGTKFLGGKGKDKDKITRGKGQNCSRAKVKVRDKISRGQGKGKDKYKDTIDRGGKGRNKIIRGRARSGTKLLGDQGQGQNYSGSKGKYRDKITRGEGKGRDKISRGQGCR